MAFLHWTEKMSVGIPTLDADHKKLVELINGLSKTMKNGGSTEDVGRALRALVDYAQYHFEMEERLLRLTKFPELESHEKCHRLLEAQVKVFEDAFNADPETFNVMELFDMMSRWLMQHILQEDMRYKDHLVAALHKNGDQNLM